jgi:TorA maturation chaperone TorD
MRRAADGRPQSPPGAQRGASGGAASAMQSERMPDDFERLAARADLCRLLAACHYEPGPEWGQERVFDAMAAAGAPLDAGIETCARRLGEAFASAQVQALLVDYTRLFLAPGSALARPYGSVWLGDGTTLMQDSTLQVVALYAEAGFEVDESFRDLPDHVAVELEFLYALLFRQAAAARSGDASGVAQAAALRSRFLGEHLGRWGGRFAEAVSKGAETGFYRILGELTGRFLRFESQASNAG